MPVLLLPLLVIAADPAPEERRFIASGFDRLEVIGPYEVEVVLGPPGVVATGDRAALDGLSVRVESGRLTVTGPAIPLLRATQVRRLPAKILVLTTGLRAAAGFDGAGIRLHDMRGQRIDLEVDGGASLSVDRVQAEELVATKNGSGSMTLAGSADRLRLSGAGTGALTADMLTAGEAQLDWQNPGPLRVAVRYAARVSNYGKGQVTIVGRPQCQVRGGGPVKCGGAPAR